MKYKVPDWLMEVANHASRIPFAKTILKPFYYRYKRIIQEQRNQHFRKHALEALCLFDKTLNESGFEYTLAFGTLLGAVREKGFIKHDFDVDVAMWAKDYCPEIKKCLEKAGFKLEHSFTVDNGEAGREETYSYNDVQIDIFYFYPPVNNIPYCCDFLCYKDAPTYRECMKKYGGSRPRRVEIPLSQKRELTTFEGKKFYIPVNAHEILQFRYGDSYMIPNPSWGISSNNAHIVEWVDKKGIYTEY